MQDNRNRCYQLNIDIQNERLRLNSLQGKLQAVLSQINPTLSDMKSAERNVQIARGEQVVDTVSAGIDKSPLTGLIKAGATAWGKQANVNTAREEYNSLRTKYDSLLSNQQEYEREIDKCYNKINSLEENYKEARC